MSALPRNLTSEANNTGNMAKPSTGVAAKPIAKGVRRRLTVLPMKKEEDATRESAQPQLPHQQAPTPVVTLASYGASAIQTGTVYKRPITGGIRKIVPGSMPVANGPVYRASPAALSGQPVYAPSHAQVHQETNRFRTHLNAAPFVPSSAMYHASDLSDGGLRRYADNLMDDGTHSEPSTLNEQPPVIEVAPMIPIRNPAFTAKALDDHNVRQAYVSKRILEVQQTHATPQKPCSCVYCHGEGSTGQCAKNETTHKNDTAALAPSEPTPIKISNAPATPARPIPTRVGPAPPTPMLDWTTTPTPAKKKPEEAPVAEESQKPVARRCIFGNDTTPRSAFPLSSTGDMKVEDQGPKFETPVASFFTRSANRGEVQQTSPVPYASSTPQSGHRDSPSSPTVLMVVGHNGRRHPVVATRCPQEIVGCHIVFEGDRGEDMGRVVDRTTLQAWRATAASDKALPHMARMGTAQEAQYWEGALLDEGRTAADVCADIVRRLRLPMFVVSASFQLDRKKLTIFYESQQQRVDFRKLCVELHSTFKCRIWMERVE